MYVLKRNGDVAYVSKPGNHNSYTTRLENAQVFDTKEQAEGSACGNEHAVSVNSILRR